MEDEEIPIVSARASKPGFALRLIAAGQSNLRRAPLMARYAAAPNRIK
jgi:hypothetical protein